MCRTSAQWESDTREMDSVHIEGNTMKTTFMVQEFLNAKTDGYIQESGGEVDGMALDPRSCVRPMSVETLRGISLEDWMACTVLSSIAECGTMDPDVARALSSTVTA
uniref:Uncharacterized protein n=1 Tax=Octactis speculum TaxID=3111310 RepID=A0A7S2GKY2_9STRA|mmetsp:Transcript_50744/g.69045  ORF Transcript_50744/g.69045 Transcript_50744/m.69045 type:complete len:107 (+) Transcript_50744:212-532(+)